MTPAENVSSGLTPAQAKAVHTLDRPLAATAGPGAGKTKVLVSRYLEILKQPNVDVDNIVAITFTTKAANQMRDRVRTGIDAEIFKHRGTDQENVWRERKRRLDSGVITTIHGFCSRLLREYPIDAKVDPRFSTLDDYTSSLMLNAAAEQAVTALINTGDETAAHLVAAYGRTTLVGALERLHNHLRGLGVKIDDARKVTETSLLTPEDYAERLAEVRARVAQIASVTDITPKAREKVDEFLESWERYRRVIETPPTPEHTVEFLETLDATRRSMPDARTKALKEAVTALRQLLGHKDFGDGKLAEGFFDVCARQYLPHVFQALGSIDFLYGDVKRNAHALDYEDLQLFVRDMLVNAPEVRRRAGARYRWFLIDEFQDTNRLQREIVNLLALDSGSRSSEPQNLFIVGDRKQSIYNFRGAEVEVFEEAVRDITAHDGEHVALDVNFRSDARLIDFFNEFFSRLMRLEAGEEPSYFTALGFVGHEPGVAHRGAAGDGPAVEFLFYTPEVDESGKPVLNEDEDSLREIEARRLAGRIKRIVEGGETIVRDAAGTGTRPAAYKDFAMLLGAFTQVKTYEHALQRAGIPYYVVAGRGFYSRPEVLDLLTLLEFLDNRTDEISLAGVLRSPLFGISDETLYSLRWAQGPENEDWRTWDGELSSTTRSESGLGIRALQPRPLFQAVLGHERIPGITGEQHELLETAAQTLRDLIRVRNRLPLSQLLERAVRVTQYDVISAAAEDGPQRLSNLDKLIVQARAFEKSEARLLRDFVEYIRNFRRLEAREAEAQLEQGLDAAAILTIHKSKGLEFPIVVLPDLQHGRTRRRDFFLFDREKGLGFRVPDQRGSTVEPSLYTNILERIELREQFEAMRQLYVGMTRAEDHLILSAAAKPMKPNQKLIREQETRLQWVCAALDAYDVPDERTVECGHASVRILGRNVELSPASLEGEAVPDEPRTESKRTFVQNAAQQARARQSAFNSLKRELEQKLSPIPASEEAQSALHYRFSVTQLVNYLNCPRQFYFARFLQMPETELRAAGKQADDAEAREGRARLSPSLRGTIVHRFCEIFREGDDLYDTLRTALDDVRGTRIDEWADELVRIDDDEVLRDLAPLAENYVYSPLYREIEERRRAGESSGRAEAGGAFVKSELSFALRTEAAMILGSIDKLLIREESDGLHVRVIDFKTNTLWANRSGFEADLAEKAAMYRIQMQAYALAAWWLLPNVKKVEATLHFLHPNREFRFPVEQTGEEACRRVVAETAKRIRAIRVMEGTQFEAKPGARCLNCRFVEVCADAVRVESQG